MMYKDLNQIVAFVNKIGYSPERIAVVVVLVVELVE